MFESMGIKKLCECGCGGEVKVGNRFINYHSRKGQHHTEETKKKLSDVNKGKIISMETREKIRKTSKGHLPWNTGKLCPELGWSKGLTKDSDMRIRKISDSSKGKIISEEQRRKQANSMKGKNIGPRAEEVKEKVSKGLKEYFKEHPVSEESRKISSERMKGNAFRTGIPHSKETKELMSMSRIKFILCAGGNPIKNKNYKRGSFYSEKNQTFLKYDSSYELTAFKILEQLSKVISYERCPYVITYEFGGSRRYLPDILVIHADSSKEIIEVKPNFMLKDVKTQAKKLAGEIYGRKNNMLYSIWTEKELGL